MKIEKSSDINQERIDDFCLMYEADSFSTLDFLNAKYSGMTREEFGRQLVSPPPKGADKQGPSKIEKIKKIINR